MLEQVLSDEALKTIELLAPVLEDFYLAGGTGLALQLGHRKSYDLDFFSSNSFNTDAVLAKIPSDKIFFTSFGTVHCEIRSIRVSLLYYEVPLLFPALVWKDIKIADLRDITAEKIKTISERGSKRDFIDLYCVIKQKYSVSDICQIFKRRFASADINYYHVIKSLVFFEDADREPSPPMLKDAKEWNWENIKSFFIENLPLFEQGLDMQT